MFVIFLFGNLFLFALIISQIVISSPDVYLFLLLF